MKHTKATKRKLSLMRRGERNPFYGKHHTDSTKARLAKSTREFNLASRKYSIGPRTVFPISDTDAAYLAGIVDGDGSIGFVKERPRISVYNTDFSMIHWLDTHLGAKGMAVDRRGRTMNYVWYTSAARDVYFLCRRLMPFLIVKHSAAKRVIAFLEGKYGRENLD